MRRVTGGGGVGSGGAGDINVAWIGSTTVPGVADAGVRASIAATAMNATAWTSADAANAPPTGGQSILSARRRPSTVDEVGIDRM